MRKRREIEADIIRYRAEMEVAEEELRQLEANCDHDWGPTAPNHIHHPAYTIPGDKPGTMGVDFRGPCHVSAKTEKRWTRVCSKCEKIEHTSNTTQRTTEEPKF